MKFVDEAVIRVVAGKGGNGCLSFLRQKFRPRGGPDGGNGGAGGNIYMVGRKKVNTLAEFRHIRQYKAENGAPGAGQARSGKDGRDLYINVPLGTIVFDAGTEEAIGDVVAEDQHLLVAAGGKRGLGNMTFKSSTNRAPRRTTQGKPGDERRLKLQLKVLADVGLLGLPNAGKSTFLRAVSRARPKVADYPFTTLYPQLGVVDNGTAAFVIADIPGLIAGAASGAGLGTRFLKHLNRTRLLLHVIDIAPADGREWGDAIGEVERELGEFDAGLGAKPRWLVFNKIDLIGAEQARATVQPWLDKTGITDPVFFISAATGEGCSALVNQIMQTLDARREEATPSRGQTAE